MATQAHCAYCFETLAANFEHRKPLSLSQVEDLWAEYHASTEQTRSGTPEQGESGEDAEMLEAEAEEPAMGKPAAISRLLNREDKSSGASSNSSLHSGRSSSSQSEAATNSGSATPASSKSSISSGSSLQSAARARMGGEKFPLFVTWNTLSRSGHKSLRGCIGTFESQELEHGLRSYALTSAFEDVRFKPIPSTLISSLSAHVTLLTNFSAPTQDPMNWTLGQHGLRISFMSHRRRYGATYLPDVAKEQGWTKEETLVSLMRKAGWNGSSSSWEKAWRDGKGELVTYEGKQVGLDFSEWLEWRDWVDEQDI